MKKKITKIIMLVCTLAIILSCAIALGACDDGNDNGSSESKTYYYVGAKVAGIAEEDEDSVSLVESLYDMQYKNSSIAVSDSTILWKVAQDAGVSMTVTKDGDKYLLSGDYINQMIQMTSDSLAYNDSIDSFDAKIYGLKTEEGFDIIMEVTVIISELDGTHVTNNSSVTFSFN